MTAGGGLATVSPEHLSRRIGDNPLREIATARDLATPLATVAVVDAASGRLIGVAQAEDSG